MRQYCFNNLAKFCRNTAILLFTVFFTACHNNTTCLPLNWGGGADISIGNVTPGQVIIPTTWLVHNNDTWHKAFDEIETHPNTLHHIYLHCCNDADCGSSCLNSPNTIEIFDPDNRNREVTNGRTVNIRNLHGIPHTLEGGPNEGTRSYITVSGSGSRLIVRGPTLDIVRLYANTGGTIELREGVIQNNFARGNAFFPQAAVNIEGVGSRFYMFGGTINNNTAPTAGAAALGVLTSGGVNLELGAVFNMTGGTIGPGNVGAHGGGVRVAGGSTFNMSFGALIIGNNTNANGQHGGGVHVTGAQFNMTGGTIEQNTAGGNSQGGGVFLNNNSTFTMSGGNISDNNTTTGAGGGVAVTGSSIFNMTVATINDNNTTTGGGGGVFITNSSTFNMNAGATISNNHITGFGGGVLVTGGARFYMRTGATISNNHILSGNGFGGGVRVAGNSSSSTFTMYGGIIELNTTATGNAGGVNVEGQTTGNYLLTPTFHMHGGEIRNNTAGPPNTTNSHGGGVHVGTCGRFFMTGGEIHGNTANGQGGGVDVRGNATGSRTVFTMNGGIIHDNVAGLRGGGVNIYGGGVYPIAHNTIYMTGGTIKDNRTYGMGGGVFIGSGNNRFYMSGTEGATIMGYPSNVSFFGTSPAITSHALRRQLGIVNLFGNITSAGNQNWNQTINILNQAP